MTTAYRELLERLDRWMESGRRAHPGVIPCRAGCTACCHGPFDVTVADVELIRDALRRMEASARADVVRRAKTLLGRMTALAPDWTTPHEVAALGDEGFDRLADALAGEPCPLLGDDGRCRIYRDRPMVCRMIGLPMRARAGRVIENACPIQDRFPPYAALAPFPFDLEGFEQGEMGCLRDAAERVLGDASRWEFETTIAAVVALAASPCGPLHDPIEELHAEP